MKRLIGDRMNCNHYSPSIRRFIQRVSVKLLSCPPDGLTVDGLCQNGLLFMSQLTEDRIVDELCSEKPIIKGDDYFLLPGTAGQY